MSRVFINYRSGDGEYSAALIERELSQRFGSRSLFRASKSIEPGEDFEKAIIRAIRRSSAMIAVVGPHWLAAPAPGGGRALDNKADWVRREIEEAFTCGVRVIPVLIGKTPVLNKGDLPSPLAGLAQCQYERLDHRTVAADITRLGDKLASLLNGMAGPEEPQGTPPGPHPPTSPIQARQGNFFFAPASVRNAVAGDMYTAGDTYQAGQGGHA